MQVVTDLRYLFSIVIIRLSVSLFYSLEPRWHPWEKALLVLVSFALIKVAMDLLKRSVTSVSVLTFQAIVTVASRWMFFYVLAQFIVLGIETVAYRWGLDAVDMTLLCLSLFLMLCALFLPLALSFGMVWCDCKSTNTCILCRLYEANKKPREEEETETEKPGTDAAVAAAASSYPNEA